LDTARVVKVMWLNEGKKLIIELMNESELRKAAK
jgi:hypothetical protein